MSKGVLLRVDNKEFKAGVEYRLQRESATDCWGELVLLESVPVDDGSGYIIELEDNRSRQCYLKKRVNRAVNGFPPRHVYYFTGKNPSRSIAETAGDSYKN